MKFLTLIAVTLNLLPFSSAFASDNISNGVGWTLSYDWLDQMINQSPTRGGLCPTLSIDNEKNGYRLALQKSFYGSVMPAISKWFPNDEIWSAVAIGPMINKFGITFSTLVDITKIDAEYERRLPTTANELARWRPNDAAYWESQGGVAFYVGAGYDPVHIGLFAVASGGWVNYVEKTGPSTVYVERAHKHINSAALSGGIGRVSVGIEKIMESAKGFNYEFNLEEARNAEAYERFMAGDATLAYELSQIDNSGVRKISDTSMQRFGKYFGMSITTPFIPAISLRSSQGKDANREEEFTVWDEHIVRDYGVYVKQNSSRLLGLHNKEAITFKGGRNIVNSKTSDASSEKFYGNFKFAYQADWGQEMMLTSKINYAREITGLDSENETCVKVPNLSQTLGYNQVMLQMNLSDEYMREILGLGSSGNSFLSQIESQAKKYDYSMRMSGGCNYSSEGNTSTSIICRSPFVEGIFSDIRQYTRRIRSSMNADQNNFSFNMANLGKAIWSNPAVFKAFFDKGKTCGAEFKFEVSGLRISKYYKEKMYSYTASCLSQ